jgi:flagellar biosynthesis/type III secretory pathway protein FliH
MTINIDGRKAMRISAVVATTIGIGAAAFFGGQQTRMSDDAVAAQKQVATETVQHRADVKLERTQAADRAHEVESVRKARIKAKRETRKIERKRAAKLAEKAREQGYSTGNSVGFSTGHSAGYSEGEVEGVNKASDELTCSDDSDVDLPACTYGDY